jgi:hypothetical protein
MTFDAGLESLTAALGRRHGLDEEIAAMVGDSRFTPVVNRARTRGEAVPGLPETARNFFCPADRI